MLRARRCSTRSSPGSEGAGGLFMFELGGEQGDEEEGDGAKWERRLKLRKPGNFLGVTSATP